MSPENAQRTIYAAYLETVRSLGKPFITMPNSTLNQKFNIYPSEKPAVNEYPILKGICIGNKGALYEIIEEDVISTKPKYHLADHAALYNHIPFLVRPIDNDISATERLNYRLRVPFTKGTIKYVAYFMKVIDISIMNPVTDIINVSNNGLTINVDTWTPSLSKLSPTPPVINNSEIVNPSGDYLSVSAMTSIILNSNDINEIMTACDIIYGNVNRAVISEIALCTGVDRQLSGQFGSVTASYTECIATQVNGFLYQYHALTYGQTEVNINLEVGAKEPLLV